MRRIFNFILVCLLFLILAASIGVMSGHAQEQTGWSPPFQISTAGRTSSRGYPVSDAYGYVHLLWDEVTVGDAGSVIQYARFNGTSWSVPLDIHLTAPTIPIVSISPYIDSKQNLHLVWTQGFSGFTRLFYTKVPSYDATDFANWSEPVRGRVIANDVRLIVDDEGTLHLLYNTITGPEIGVFYTSSKDEGITWSDPVWLDPDIPTNNIPNSIQFGMDDSGGFHAVWYYSSTEDSSGNWVRYSHSLDGGSHWSQPITIARIPDDDDVNTLSAAGPVMAVEGDSVHIVYAGGEFHYRNHTYSTDRGNTWTTPVRIFGNLQGQAFESLIVDDIGRIHYFGQVRYPVGIYHSVWENGDWSPTELVYLISANSDDPIGDRIHAHHVYPAIRAGNQVVLTFADPPPTEGRRLFSMVGMLEGAPALTPLPEPTPAAIITESPIIESQITATATTQALVPQNVNSDQVGPPRGIIIAGLISPLILLAATFIIRMYFLRTNR
jgi:hypothetical protein